MDFEDDLMRLIDGAMTRGVDREEIIGALELRLMALREEEAGDDD